MTCLILLVLLTFAGCPDTGTTPAVTTPTPVDGRPVLDERARRRLLDDLAWMADDAREGRATGTPGNAATRDWLVGRFTEIGLEPFGPSFERPFTTSRLSGANVVGMLKGSGESSGDYIVVTAHFDHLGVQGGEIYNGADDNASGTAALLAAAAWFKTHPTRHSIIFAALDAEERGLQGARAFLAEPPVGHEDMTLNINLDMIGRNEQRELYAAGTSHWPALRGALEEVAERSAVTLLFGHDGSASGPDDWTFQSDHGPFHAAGVPFVYFGVEDHPDYHQATDEVSGIEPGFFVDAAETVMDAISTLDLRLDSASARAR